jgi:hypothetical protein
MVIEFRNKATGRKLRRTAKLKSNGHPCRVLLRSGRALSAHAWLVRRTRIVQGTSEEKCRVLAWLLGSSRLLD